MRSPFARSSTLLLVLVAAGACTSSPAPAPMTPDTQGVLDGGAAVDAGGVPEEAGPSPEAGPPDEAGPPEEAGPPSTDAGGDAADAADARPPLNKFDPILDVALGGAYACALMVDHTVRCWGFGGPALGYKTTTKCGQASQLACSTVPTPVPGVANAIDLAAGGGATYAIRSDGAVLTWGDNTYGQLGDSTPGSRDAATVVPALQGAVHIAAGQSHACARFADNSVKCWGRNIEGEVGDGTKAPPVGPVAAQVTDAIAITTEEFSTCALRAAGPLVCWGYDERGELGDGNVNVAASPNPVTVSGLAAHALTVGGSGKSGGYGHACATLDDGTARCWGENGLGELGNATTSYKEVIPVVVTGLKDAIAIAPGGAHTCALRTNQTVVCWGGNLAGQLGDGTNQERHSPVAVVNLTAVTRIAASDAESCAITSNGRLYCWGGNGTGQLGDGTIDSRSVPTPVVW